jgi:hypothetical protein
MGRNSSRVGRTRGSFLVAGASPPTVLATVVQFGGANKLAAVYTAANQLVLSQGSSSVSGRRTIVVTVFDGVQGTLVGVEAWTTVDMWGDFDANPKVIVGAFPRRAMWKLLTKLTEALGVPAAVSGFEHGG